MRSATLKLSLALSMVFAASSPSLADSDVTKKLADTRRSVTLLHLKMQEANALAELKELQNLATPEDWARHEAKKAAAEKKPALDAYGMPVAQHNAPYGTPAPAAGNQQVNDTVDVVDPMPRVVAVFGSGKALYASLRYPSGKSMDVRVGDELETGHKVTRISANEVGVTKDGRSGVLGSYTGSPPSIAHKVMNPEPPAAPSYRPPVIPPAMPAPVLPPVVLPDRTGAMPPPSPVPPPAPVNEARAVTTSSPSSVNEQK